MKYSSATSLDSKLKRLVSNVVAFIRYAPLAIFLFVAVAGAFAALIGGAAARRRGGWADVSEFGKLAAGRVALGYWIWIFIPALIQAL